MQKLYKYIPGSGFFRGISIGVLLTTWAVFTFIPGYKLWPAMPNSSTTGMTLDRLPDALEELYHEVSIQYYDTGAVSEDKMSQQALSAFVDALGDPFSSYLPPAEQKELTDAIEGNESIEGIGAVLSKKDGGVMVEEVLKGSPAAGADIKPLDMIVKVNGSGVVNMTIRQVVDQVRGPKGTDVDLTIARTTGSGVIEVLNKTVTRDKIIIPSVASKTYTVDDKTIGYVALSLFAQDTDERLVTEISKLKTAKIQGLILDLRGNGGGLLPESVDVASHFLAAGTPIVSVKYRLFSDSTYKAEGNPSLVDIPVVILVDGFTASASEIIALALKEGSCPVDTKVTALTKNCRTILVGEKTFGKGSIQNLQNLSFGGSLKLTVGKWFAPSGKSIDHIGIEPDVAVIFDRDLYAKKSIDTQLEKAKEILTKAIAN